MIYIGTSGFSYDDWKGHFYPEKFDKKSMLDFYARQFPAVEINSTYYTIPGPTSFAGMDRKTPPGFRFVVKAHQDMTHIDKPADETFEAFRAAIDPLRYAGKLGCVLAQFPWSFRHTAENYDQVRSFKERMGDLPTVVEFRNADWVNDDAFALLRELDLGFCSVDEPHLKGLMPPLAAATSKIGYVRFHGRNAKKWWKHDQPHERYDYLYTEDELSEWVPKAQAIASQTERTYLFFNNHYHGKSAQNARMFAKMMGIELPLESSVEPQLTLGEGF